MNDNQFEVTVNLTNQKVLFAGVSKSNPERPIAFDYLPPLGDGQGYRGLELLLMSFTGCVSTAIVYLLRKMGKTISSFKVNAKGIRREQPLSIQKIRLEVILESKDARDSDIQSAIKQAEELSPVWTMLKDNVEVIIEYKIIVI
ncbi:MAG: OsmC family protein [Desulfosporosinus sp.]|nr:OsmC family protein [Desulfosporosinus sp.]